MNENKNTPDVNSASGAAVAFIAGALIFLVLIVIVKLTLKVPAIDANRAKFISDNLYQIRTNEVVSLNNPGWVDKDRGVVRLPIDRAMQLTEFYWQDPAAGRNELIARAQKAAAPAPKKANPFE
jgi:hypothetical protein